MRSTSIWLFVTAVFLSSSFPSFGQITFVPDTTRRLTVTGKGEAQVAPDSARVTLGVRALDKDLRIAKETVDGSIGDMLKLAMELGIDESNVRTTALYVSPEYSYEHEDEFLGYEVTRSLTVQLEDLDKLDPLLDGAVAVGANDSFDVSLSSSQEEDYRALARKRAIEDARNQAQDAARQLGVRIAAVRSISLDPPKRTLTTYSAATVSRGAGTFLPGDVTFQAEVSVVFLLEDVVEEN